MFIADIETADPYSLREGRKEIILEMLRQGETGRLTEDGRRFTLRHRADGHLAAFVTEDGGRGWAKILMTVIEAN